MAVCVCEVATPAAVLQVGPGRAARRRGRRRAAQGQGPNLPGPGLWQGAQVECRPPPIMPTALMTFMIPGGHDASPLGAFVAPQTATPQCLTYTADGSPDVLPFGAHWSGTSAPSWGMDSGSSASGFQCPDPPTPKAQDGAEFEATDDFKGMAADGAHTEGIQLEVVSISGVKICDIVQQRDCTVQEIQSVVAQRAGAPVSEVQLVLGGTMLDEPSSRPLADLDSPAAPVMIYMIRKNTRCKKGVWLRNRKLPKSCITPASSPVQA